MLQQKILVAGATGYLGKYIVATLLQQGFHTTALARQPHKLEGLSVDAVIHAEVTKPTTIQGCCDTIDCVISTVGITKQTDGLSYMEVDYQANLNLLNEAQKSGVKKFIYISVFNGDLLKNLKICEAKERFVEALKNSGLEYCIIRPNGFFSDMTEFYHMAQKGQVYLFGDGNLQLNPIHGQDLAQFCVEAITEQQSEINVGGPFVLRQNEIAGLAFKAVGKPIKIRYIPHWLRKMLLRLLRRILPAKTFGPIEFFMTVMAMEMIAPQYGTHSLQSYFKSLGSTPKT